MVVAASDITPEEDTGLLDSDVDPPGDEVNEVNAPLLDYLEEENLDSNKEVSNDAQDLTIDPTTIYGQPSFVNNVLARRILPPQNGFPLVIFDIDAIKLLRSPTAWLNGVCINGYIPLLFASIRSNNWNAFVVFFTHDLSQFQYNATDEVLW
ncbi:hypothetical protein HD554DRAFT_2175123 [Boletus coccyginus]|nr:hypothetical protein HD554DRAFT_2175123 [Boletus coccyginus]